MGIIKKTSETMKCDTCVFDKKVSRQCGNCIWNYTRRTDNWKLKPSLKGR